MPLEQQWEEFLSFSKSNTFIYSHCYLEVYKIAFSFRHGFSKIFDKIYVGAVFLQGNTVTFCIACQRKEMLEREEEPILLKPIINDSCPCITFHKRKELSRWFNP